MSDEEILQTRIPAQVLALALQARTARAERPVPVSWRVEKAYTVIVFEDGRKLTFEQQPIEEEPEAAEAAEVEQIPAYVAPTQRKRRG